MPKIPDFYHLMVPQPHSENEKQHFFRVLFNLKS